MTLRYENKQLLMNEGIKKIVIAEWDKELSIEEVNALRAGFSPLFFKQGLKRYNCFADRAFLYGLTPII